MLLKVEALAALLIPIYFLGSLWLHRKRSWPWSRIFLLGLFLAYALSVARVTLFPIPFLPGMAEQFGDRLDVFAVVRVWPDLELITNGSAAQVLGNVALGVPFGLLAPLCWRLRPKRLVLLGFVASGAVEAIQLLISLGLGWPYRTVDSTDILLNGVGVLGGYLLLRLSLPLLRTAFSRDTSQPDDYLTETLAALSGTGLRSRKSHRSAERGRTAAPSAEAVKPLDTAS